MDEITKDVDKEIERRPRWSLGHSDNRRSGRRGRGARKRNSEGATRGVERKPREGGVLEAKRTKYYKEDQVINRVKMLLGPELRIGHLI